MSESNNEREAAGPTRTRKKSKEARDVSTKHFSKKLRNTGQAYVSRATSSNLRHVLLVSRVMMVVLRK